MLILRETKKNVKEENAKIQKMAYELFIYLANIDLPPGQKIPDFDEAVRQAHAKNYYNNLAEFLQAVGNYTGGYARSMKKDEKKYNADYWSRVYEEIAYKLTGIMLKIKT
jgi:hypothetical protein